MTHPITVERQSTQDTGGGSFDTVSSNAAGPTQGVDRDSFLAARRELNWGSRFTPELRDGEGRDTYLLLINRILEVLGGFDEFDVTAAVPDEAAGLQCQIMDLIEELYELEFGREDGVKAAVTVLQSQLGNADWTNTHLEFLREALRTMRSKWIVDQSTAEQILDLTEEFGLDPFRGSVSDTGFKKRFKIVEVTE